MSDFWYTRMLDPRTLAITGLTRNGVWLIEDGDVTRPLRNFRFTQSYAQALMPGNVKAVGRTSTPGARRHVHGDRTAVVVPCVAPRVVELHGRRLRLSRVDGCSTVTVDVVTESRKSTVEVEAEAGAGRDRDVAVDDGDRVERRCRGRRSGSRR